MESTWCFVLFVRLRGRSKRRASRRLGKSSSQLFPAVTRPRPRQRCMSRRHSGETVTRGSSNRFCEGNRYAQACRRLGTSQRVLGLGSGSVGTLFATAEAFVLETSEVRRKCSRVVLLQKFVGENQMARIARDSPSRECEKRRLAGVTIFLEEMAW